MSKEKSIVWADNENHQIMNSLLLLRLKYPQETLRELFMKAQDVLPEHRRRELPTINAWKWLPNFKEHWKMFVQRTEDLLKDPSQLATVVDKVDSVEMYSVQIRETVEPSLAEIIRRVPLVDLIQAAFAKSEQDTTDRIAREMSRFFAAFQDSRSVPKPVVEVRPVKPKKLRIAILGPLPDQFRHIEEKVGDKADLIFLDKDAKRSSTPPMIDHLIGTRHIHHSDESQAKNMLEEGDRYHYVDGGIKSVVQKVLDICARQ